LITSAVASSAGLVSRERSMSASKSALTIHAAGFPMSAARSRRTPEAAIQSSALMGMSAAD
jgi:hypothetical protein